MGVTKIEWTASVASDGSIHPGYTFNPWIGCQEVSPGCDHCYARVQNAHRKWNGGTWGPHSPRKRTSPGYWKQPIRWAKRAREEGIRPRVFCASLADVFDNQVPIDWRAELFALIKETSELDWLLLTKRPENMSGFLPADWFGGYPNVWLGTTAEDQLRADHRLPKLLDTHARIRFVSFEPLIGWIECIENLGRVSIRLPSEITPPSVTLTRDDKVGDIIKALGGDIVPGPRIDWAIIGGESGTGFRPMQRAWVDSLIEQCRAADVAIFFKQMAGKASIPDDLMIREFPRVNL